MNVHLCILLIKNELYNKRNHEKADKNYGPSKKIPYSKRKTEIEKGGQSMECQKKNTLRQAQRFFLNKSNSKLEFFFRQHLKYHRMKMSLNCVSTEAADSNAANQTNKANIKNEKRSLCRWKWPLGFVAMVFTMYWTLYDFMSFLMPFFFFSFLLLNPIHRPSSHWFSRQHTHTHTKTHFAIIFYYISMSDARFCSH